MMATYYSSGGSEIQPAGAVAAAGPPDSSNNLQTLYLMNPTFSSGGGGGGGGRGTSYNHHPSSSSSSHDQQHHNQLPTNMFLLNSHDPSVVTSSSSSSPFSHTFHQQQQHHHHLVGIPLPTQSPHHHQDDHRPSPSSSSGGTTLNIHEIPPTSLHGFLPRVHYNLWNSAATTVTTQLDPSSSSSPHHHIPTAIAMTTSSDGFRRPPPLTIHQHYHQQQQQQGLSLSLNNNNNNNSPNTNNKITTIVQDPVVGHHQTVSGMGLLPHHMGTIIPGDNSSTGPPTSTSGMTNVVGGVGSLVLGSKYLKVTQELLDEVVNVETGVVVNDKVVVDSNNQKDKLVVMGIEGGETSVGGGVSQQPQQQELSTTQRQELQMKKAKLLNMLDEVEQRYRQYHTQMQIVVTSFEQTAGIGSARSYTALALQTISKQFRCLKDAITSQIKATSKTLGEDDASYNSKGAAGGDGTHTTTTTTRLRFVDHQLRQQRALQQLGMVQHNAWRPQRGLPERAVSVLRAWLFEHFLHPYPKDSDKHMLAKQTGLTRSQVSNWFINARVRLWKPMVEEMYLEEVKAQEQNNTTTNHHRVNDQNNNPVTVATGANNINNNEHLDNNDHDSSSAINNRSSSSNPIHTHHTHQQQPQVEKSTHILNHTNTLHDHHHNISNPPTILSSPTQLGHHHHHLHHQSGGTSAALQNFSLIGTSSAPDMESILFRRSPKRQRSIDIHHNNNNSPTSIISMEMEMKSGGNQDHQPTQNHLFMTPAPAGGFGPFPTMGEIGSRSSFDPSDQQQLAAHQFMHGNGGVSLTLGLPHGENQLSPHHHHQQLQHHNFIPTQNMQLAGRRVVDHHQIEQVGDHHHHHHHHQQQRAAAAAAAAEFCGITNSTQQPPSGTAGAYDGIDLQNRKRFAAAQLLPDFVIHQ